MREPRVRLKAVFFAVLFLAGQFGPGGWDMLSHLRAASPVGVHVEAQNTRACHAERCMLGYVAPTAPVARTVVPVIKVYAIITARGLPAADQNRSRPDYLTLHQPRAPPPTPV